MEVKEKKLSELTDQELIQESKKMKSMHIMNALVIGFMIGIVVYSTLNNSLGFFTLIPLFFVYKLVNKSNYRNKELKSLLKERNLK
jgi:hypothetical protein